MSNRVKVMGVVNVTPDSFSDKLGVVSYGENQDEVFLGHSVSRTQSVSEETANLIDAEV